MKLDIDKSKVKIEFNDDVMTVQLIENGIDGTLININVDDLKSILNEYEQVKKPKKELKDE